MNSATFLETNQLVQLYDRALEVLEASTSEAANGIGTAHLRHLLGFRRAEVRWAATDAAGGTKAIQASLTGRAWLVALSPRDPSARTQPSVFSTDWISTTAVAIRIRPVPFTTEWAALGLVNGLEHLEAAVSGREPPFRVTWQHHAEDVRGYEVELDAADVLSRDRYRRAAVDLLRQRKWTGIDDVLRAHESGSLVGIVTPLTTVISNVPAASPGELNTRLGLAVVAIGLIAIETTVSDPETQFQAKVDFLGRLMGPPPRPFKPAPPVRRGP
jgi:hypothetical protein